MLGFEEIDDIEEGGEGEDELMGNSPQLTCIMTSESSPAELLLRSQFDWQIVSSCVDQLDLRNGGAKFSWERQWNKRYKTKFEFTNAEFKYDYDFDARRKFDDQRLPVFLRESQQTRNNLKYNAYMYTHK